MGGCVRDSAEGEWEGGRVCEGSMKPVGGVSGRVQKGSRRGDWANSAPQPGG